MLYYLYNGMGSVVKPYYYAIYNGDLPKVRYTSRANARSCGSGPYFLGEAEPTYFYNSSLVKISRDTTYYGVTDPWDRQCGYYTDWNNGYLVRSSPNNNMTECYRNVCRIVDLPDGTYVYGWSVNKEIWNNRAATNAISNAIRDRKMSIGLISEVFGSLDPNWDKPTWKTRVIDSSGRVLAGTPITSFENASLSFPDNIYSVFVESAEFGWFRYGTASKFSTAYVNAVKALKLSDVNTLANMVELFSTIRAFLDVIREPVKGFTELIHKVRDPRNAWLAYRYSYQTTRMDVHEYKATLSRLRALSNMLGKDIHSIGEFQDNTGSYRAEIRLAATQVFPSDAVERLEGIGLSPTPANLWDLIPYSFVVDWFLNVSDILQWADDVGNTFDYSPKEVWFTHKRQFGNEFYFYRVPGRKLDVAPYYEERHASGKTIRLRVADSVALFLR